MADDALIRTLSANDIRNHVEDFLAIAADQSREYWTEAHFLADFPEKWSLSFAAWRGGRPVAYAVLSRKATDVIHLHHFMVAADERGRGLGTRMLREMESRARAAGASRLTLKVAVDSAAARRFYQRAGFRETGLAGDYRLLERAL